MFQVDSETKDLPRSGKKLGWFNRLAMILNIIFVAAILLSYFSRVVSPEKNWYMAFFGLGYPVLFLINLLFVVYWLLQMRMQFLFSLIALLIGYKSFFSYVQWGNQANVSSAAPSTKVMTYNCMLFDLYNWSNNANSRKMIFDLLSKEKPDILCLQEFYSSENPNSFNNINDLVRVLNLPYHHHAYTTTLRQTDHWGIITLSKYPIINTGIIKFQTKTNNCCIYTDMLVGNDTVRVYNLHLQSIQFEKDDYKYVADVIENKNEEDIRHSRSILKRLKRGFVKRAKQAQMVASSINSCNYKIIVCGDFNDTPTSYAYHEVRGDLLDAFVERGSGLEKTYNGAFPAFRIDNIFHSEQIKTLSYKRVKSSITDHFPVTATLRISDK